MTVIPILLYHSISQEPSDWIAPYTVSPDAFSQHVEFIVGSGRTAMTVSALEAALRGDSPLPPRPVVVTFDDGFSDFTAAATELAANRIPSTLYVTTGALRGRGPRPPDMALPQADMLDWSQLAELSELSVEIGAHTHTHRQLDTMRSGAVSDEIVRSKEMLEDSLGHAVPSFAYPHGFQSKRTRRVIESAGHTSACAVMNALSSDSDNLFALARLTVGATTTPQQMSGWLEGVGAPVAPYPEKLRTTAWRLYRRARGTRSSRGVFSTSISGG
jgi:peptidoglycan/xylan/chitin deacetylase (PgdA/CDA1 family)